MTNIATLADSQLDPQAAYEQLKSVEQIVKEIDSADLLIDVLDRAKLAQAWLKVKDAAANVVVQACRVQLAAVRRIGQLGEEAIALLTDPTEQKFASQIATLTDARFEGELDALERPIKASTFMQNINHAHAYALWLNAGYDIAEGKPSDDRELYSLAREAEARKRAESGKPPTKRQQEDDEWRKRHEREEDCERVSLMGQMLRSLYKKGDPFSVSEATDRMIESFAANGMLDFGDPRDLEYAAAASWVREGVTAAIRHSLMDSAAFDDTAAESIYIAAVGTEIHPPQFVTYCDPKVGWVRIPWSSAGLLQLQEMAALRRKQSAELAAKAAQLTALVEELEKAAARKPTETRVAELFRNAKRTNECKRGDA